VRSISRPMYVLAAAARRYGRGDFSARVPEKGVEELRELAAALNEMAVATGVARAQLSEQAARLAASKEEAERAGRAKSEFLARQRRIAMRAEFAAGSDTWVEADRQRLKQILLNLLANAVKYNRDEGSVTVTLKPVNGRARIRVTDTGLGIAQDQLPKLFTPF